MTRTDDELLALAAKAGGVDGTKPWNPLTNSGDAFELAVKLRMMVTVERDHVHVIGDDYGNCRIWTGATPEVDTRRAIVEVAAAAGEFMP